MVQKKRNMKAENITIGDEILIGQWLTPTRLDERTIKPVWRRGFPDHFGARQPRPYFNCLKRGLAAGSISTDYRRTGPTKDNITKKVLCEYFNTELVFHPEIWSMSRLAHPAKCGHQPVEPRPGFAAGQLHNPA
jgi:nicotinamide-nucleotide amidase